MHERFLTLPARSGRLAKVLPYLDCGERISRCTWGCCFLVLVKSEVDPDGELRMVEAAANGWKSSPARLDGADVMAEDWYVVPDERFQQWCADVGHDVCVFKEGT